MTTDKQLEVLCSGVGSSEIENQAHEVSMRELLPYTDVIEKQADLLRDPEVNGLLLELIDNTPTWFGAETKQRILAGQSVSSAMGINCIEVFDGCAMILMDGCEILLGSEPGQPADSKMTIFRYPLYDTNRYMLINSQIDTVADGSLCDFGGKLVSLRNKLYTALADTILDTSYNGDIDTLQSRQTQRKLYEKLIIPPRAHTL